MRTKSFRLGKTEAIRVAIAGVTSIGSSVFDGCGLKSVTFEASGGWRYTENENYTDGTEIDVTTPAQNATYLTSTYCSYYWYKQ